MDQTWGTRLPGEQGLEEAKDLTAETTIGGKLVSAQPGARDVPDGDVVITYPIGKGGEKSLSFANLAGVISVQVKHPGEFVEQLPMLVPRDMTISDGVATAGYKDGMLRIWFGPGVKATARATRVTIAGKKLVVLELSSKDALKYEISFGPC